MKKLMVLVLGMVMTLSANAQIVKDLEYPAAHFGLRGAFTTNSATFSSGSDPDALPFGSFGAALDIRLTPSLPIYLETGLYYMNKGYSKENKYGEDCIMNTHSVIMPVLASYHLYLTDNMSLQPFLGFYVGGGFNDANDEDDWKYYDDEFRFDSGIRLGLGWNFGRLYLNMGYDLGFKTSVDDENYKYDRTNNTFFATLGINFAGGY